MRSRQGGYCHRESASEYRHLVCWSDESMLKHWRLVLAVLLALGIPATSTLVFPIRAFAVTLTEPEYHAIVDSYGYTDEGITISTLASRLGVSQSEAGWLVALVDQYATSNPGWQPVVASQLANTAAAYKAWLDANGHWGSFQSAVNNAKTIGDTAYLPTEFLRDLFGLNSLAQPRSFGTTSVAGVTYSSGFASESHLPKLTDRAWPQTAGESMDATAKAAWYGVLYNAGYNIKLSNVSYNGGSDYGNPYENFASNGYWLCANCGATGWLGNGVADLSGFTVKYNLHNCTVAYSQYSAWQTHVCPTSTPIPTESQTSIATAFTSGFPGWVSLASGALSNPGFTVAQAIDTIGIPGYLPPGVVGDTINATDKLGADLRSRAESIAVNSVDWPVGFRELGGGLGDLGKGIADGFDSIQNWFASLFTLSPDFGKVIVPRKLDSWSYQVRFKTIAGVFNWVADIWDSVSKSSSGDDLLRVDIPLGATTFHVDLVEAAILPLIRFRGYFTGALYLMFGLMLWRKFGLMPRFFHNDETIGDHMSGGGS